jgi:hypothetical protein
LRLSSNFAISPTKKRFIAAVIKKLVLWHILESLAFAVPHKPLDFDRCIGCIAASVSDFETLWTDFETL